MNKAKGLPEIVGEVFGLLEPLESDDRHKVVGSVMTLLGENSISAPKTNMTQASDMQSDARNDDNQSFGTRATRWMSQNNVSTAALEEVFHVDAGDVEVIAREIPGSGKRGQSLNCYLLEGVKALLATDEPKFTDAAAVSLCRTMGCYDPPNHSKTRNELGNNVAGSKSGGFTLPAPGLRAAAELVKSMSASV